MQSKALESPSAPVTHTLFQVSTSGALVAGLFSGVVSCNTLLEHGDLGLGTFADLDGEMVVVDGHVFRVRGDGTVSEAPAETEAPFAVVTRFGADVDQNINAVESLEVLSAHCDKARHSSNIFYAFRLDGTFDMVRTRAVSPSLNHGRLIDAAKVQTEFAFRDIAGSLIGFWSPGFSSAFSIPGYHFHFISDDRRHGGHLLACSSATLRLRAEILTDFHLALPENEAFLRADLSKNSADELAYAEQAH
jgi:acetolactate decarboxylase